MSNFKKKLAGLFLYISMEIQYFYSVENSHFVFFDNLLYSRLLSRNVKIKIYKTIILSVVLYG
jgi:hypothetical protein